jgi:hypothetical protein
MSKSGFPMVEPVPTMNSRDHINRNIHVPGMMSSYAALQRPHSATFISDDKIIRDQVGGSLHLLKNRSDQSFQHWQDPAFSWTSFACICI